MANFGAVITVGATVKTWTDPPGLLPSRLNATTGVPHAYYSVPPNTAVQIRCTDVNGVIIPDDDITLGGVLFTYGFIETPAIGAVPAVINPFNLSVIANVQVVTPGHYLLGIYRYTSGAFLLHFTCE